MSLVTGAYIGVDSLENKRVINKNESEDEICDGEYKNKPEVKNLYGDL